MAYICGLKEKTFTMFKKITGFVVLILISTQIFAQSFNSPESVVFDPQQNRYLISNAGSGTILQRSSVGTLSTFASGLNSPKGMVIVGTSVYVTDVNRIKAYNLANGQQVLNRPISGSVFLNDITYDGNRYLYFTDMSADKIFRMDILNQSFFPFVSSGINSPNGIYYDGSLQRLLLVSYRNNSPIQAVNIGNQQLSTLQTTSLNNLDGITMDDSGNVYISSWGTNAIYKVDKSFNQTPVKIDSNFNGPADLMFNTYSKLIAIPDMNNNSLIFHNVNEPKINILGGSQVCDGESTSLETYQGLGLNFEWFRNDTSIGNGNTIIADKGGYYTVKVSNLGGTSNSDTAWITIRPKPSKPNVMVTGATQFCLGDSLLLSGPSGFLYQWSTGEQTRAIYAKETGNYALSVINGYGCSSSPSDNVFIRVFPDFKNPVITPLGPTDFCYGDSVGLRGISGYDLIWSNGDKGLIIQVDTTMIVTLQLKDTNNCLSNVSKQMVITSYKNPAKPLITASGNTEFCDGDSIVLSGPKNYFKYYWNGDTSSMTKIVDLSMQYSLQVMDTNKCLSPVSDTVNVIVKPKPSTPVISYIGNTEFCDGDSLIASGPDGYNQYLWSNNHNKKTLVIKESDTVSLKVMNDYNCVSDKSENLIITLHLRPEKPEIEIMGDTALCEGESVMLSGPENFAKYIWTINDTTQNIEIDSTSAITLQVWDSNNCESPISDTVFVNVYEKPSKPEISEYNNDTLVCNIDSVDYIWFYNGTDIPFYTKYINQVGDGTYKVLVFNGHCYSDTSDTYNFIYGSLADFDKYFKVYPNPANGAFFIESENLTNQMQLSIISSDGKLILNKLITEPRTQIDLRNFDSGLYLIRILKDKEIFTKRLIVK
jgi:hypothetical protein